MNGVLHEKLNSIDSEPQNEFEILFDSISNSNISIVTKIIENKYLEVLQYEDETKMTVLHKSVFLNQNLITSVILKILNLKLKINNLNEDLLKTFINKKCDNGYTAIHYASFRGNIDIIETLIEYGADYLMKTNRGLNNLHVAAQGDQPEILVYFKDKYHFDILESDKNGSTPLHWACFKGSENCIKFLLSWMDNVNMKEGLGYTPLHLAIFSDRTKIVKKLIYKGARLDEVDIRGRTPIQIAIENNKQNMVKMLSENMSLSDWISRPPLTKADNSYLNLVLFVILHVFGELGTIIILMPILQNYLLEILYISIGSILLILFIILVYSDPGYLYNKSKNTFLEIVQRREKIDQYCPICIIYLDQYSKHCHICGKCVEEYDHHCFWVRNCVGKNNMTYFILFLLLTTFNLLINFYISYKVFNLDFDSYLNIFLIFSFWTTFRSVRIFSALIMIVSICFLVPVIINLVVQIRNKFTKMKQRRLGIKQKDNQQLLN